MMINQTSTTRAQSSSIRRNARRGALAVEMALCLPILFLLLFGSFELARANMMLHATESAAYEGARVGIVPGANKTKIEAAVRFVMGSVGVQNFTVTVVPDTILSDTETVEVTVAVPFRENTTFAGFFIKDPTFKGTTLLTREIVR